MELLQLPDTLLAEIASFAMADWPQTAAVSRTLCDLIGRLRHTCTAADVDQLGLRRQHLPTSLECLLACTLRNLTNLRMLDLNSIPLMDGVLPKIALYCPLLETLNLRGCEYLTDEGVQSLNKLAHIQCLDITFCNLVGYTTVVKLRECCEKLRVIRRQPEWLDGRFETPWGEVCTSASISTSAHARLLRRLPPSRVVCEQSLPHTC